MRDVIVAVQAALVEMAEFLVRRGTRSWRPALLAIPLIGSCGAGWGSTPGGGDGKTEQAYNLGNFMRTLAMPKAAEPWSLTSLREKLIKIGAKVVSHGRYVTFQMAEVAVPRKMFQEILALIARLRAPPAPA